MTDVRDADPDYGPPAVPDGAWRWVRRTERPTYSSQWCLSDDGTSTFCGGAADPDNQHPLGEFVPISRDAQCLNAATSLLGITR